MKHSNHSGFSPVYANGKYAQKSNTKHDNYGTDTFKYAKKVARHASKTKLKTTDLTDL